MDGESRHQSAMLVHPIPTSTRFAGCCMLHLASQPQLQLQVPPSLSKLQLLLVNKKRHGVARAVRNEYDESTRGGAIQIGCVVLDIEGTTTPISFVTDVLFPYARSNVRAHLAATYHTQETKEDVALLRAQVQQDLADRVPGAVPLPLPPEPDVDALVANVEAMIDADRKVTALKQLQGRIWRTGFQSGHIKGLVYDDVPQALAKWHAAGIKCYIYSSGSREAQRLIFGNTTHGDLRKYLCGFFDTTTGPKREARSYYEIWQSVGVDHPSQILFLTDVHQEATAAKGAGLEVLISIRPGNPPLPENHGFQTITSFAEISI